MNTKKMLLSEEDIKRCYITPALERVWPACDIRMEKPITDGRVNIRGNMEMRERPKFADYVLYTHAGYPLAIVEAKDNKHNVSFGIQQAKTYAQMMDIQFAYSSNGDAFAEYDFLTGVEREFPLDEFPSQEMLAARLKEEAHLTQKEIKVIEQPFYVSEDTYAPRYYQQVAVDRALGAIARGQQRILLVMATGTGKTYTAFQIIYRLRKAGLKKKILYLADRNILVDQSIQQDFRPLANVIHKVNYAADDRTTITAYEVYFSLYQQLFGENDEERFRELFDPGFFDLIVIDECHRGSAKADGRWRRILDYFQDATQIGMTATPKETSYVSNIDYFGEPVYTYSLKQGIDDGFLAPFRVINVHLNIGEGWRPRKGQRDFFGNEIEDRIYNNTDYDYHIVLEDRIREVAAHITQYLRQTDRMAKTIVFCADEAAAERMRQELTKQNADMMKQYPNYVVRITGSDTYGKSQLSYFISVSSSVPVIATTSQLLSTGVDCKMVKLIVLDENITSMTMFKQIIGRGTRLRYNEGKRSFVIMDFRGVTRLFADPDWDGPIVEDPDYGKGKGGTTTGTGGSGNGGNGGAPSPKPFVRADGCKVYTVQETVSVYDAGGKLLKQENIINYTKENILGQFGDLHAFIQQWNSAKKKRAIADALAVHGVDLDKLKQAMKMDDVDDFDFICHVAYDQKPLTRRERAEGVKKRDFLSRYSGAAREVLETLLDSYMNLGIKNIEQIDVLKMKDFQKFGKPARIAKLFNGKQGYEEAVRALENELYKAG
ncbi:EcoAI/FtnUII family type I restriction enzme subunit R [uncultured Megasphaera sp.]|uniref:EcoAI/FtnUII family type I restriction enzme subunit R n=1 Tax=uncultured Megasphaera sp. TaxID=165188 RepID=UPI0026598B72|nr:DEAD/DEAH box helicase family protein [uncultured Megasphaera sp.]